DEMVVARAPDQDVVAVAAVLRQADRAGGQPRSRHGVVAGLGLDDQLVVVRLGAGDVHLHGQAGDGNAGRVAHDGDGIVVRGAVDDARVGRAVAGAAARRARQVDVDLGHGGTREVVDRDLVGAAVGGDVDHLDAVHVHGDGADVAGQPQAGAVG